MGNISSADFAAWGANAVAALAWWFPPRERQPVCSANSEVSQHASQRNVAADYRAEQEAERVELARRLQRQEESMSDSMADLERELLLSRRVTERDERLRERLLGLQGQYRVQVEDRDNGRHIDHRADRGDHNRPGAVPQVDPPEQRRGREARRRGTTSSPSEAPSSTIVGGDRRPHQEMESGRVVRRRSTETTFTLRASSR